MNDVKETVDKSISKYGKDCPECRYYSTRNIMYIRLVFPVVFPTYNIEIRKIKTRTDTISTMWSMLSMCDSISSSISMRVIKNIQKLTHEK